MTTSAFETSTKAKAVVKASPAKDLDILKNTALTDTIPYKGVENVKE
jgi:hypothetical protein